MDLYALLTQRLARDAVWDYQLLHYVLLYALGTAVLVFRWGRGVERIMQADVAFVAIPAMWVTLCGTRPVADVLRALLQGTPLSGLAGYREAVFFLLAATVITVWSMSSWPGTRHHVPAWAGAALAALASLYGRAMP